MPSYGEFIMPPPRDDRPVGNVPSAPKEEPKSTESTSDVCARCGQENCKHKR